MPQAITADRGLVQALYMQGFSPGQIAAKTGLHSGTITTWSHRYGWKKSRSEALAVVESQTVRLSSPTVSRSVSGHSDRVREKLSDRIESQVDKLSGIPIRPGLSNLRKHVEVTKLIVDAARPVFGWDEQHATTAVSVESMMDLAHRPSLDSQVLTVSVSPVLDPATPPAVRDPATTPETDPPECPSI